MTASEYQQLADFFVDQLGRQSRELRSLIAVSVESLRGEIRPVADGVLTNSRRIDENTRVLEQHSRVIQQHSLVIEQHSLVIEQHGRVIEQHSHAIEANSRRIDALSERLGGLEGTVGKLFEDHEARIRALERRRAPAS